MKTHLNGMQGVLSVFLAMVLSVILVLFCTLYESERIRTDKVLMKLALNSSLESAKASYCRELFEDYGLLFYWAGTESLEERIEDYLAYSVNPRLGLITGASGGIQIQNYTLTVSGQLRACDNAAYALRSEMLEAVGIGNARTLYLILNMQEKQAEEAIENYEEWRKNTEFTDFPEDGGITGFLQFGAESFATELTKEILLRISEMTALPALGLCVPKSVNLSDRKLDSDSMNAGIVWTFSFEPVISSRILEKTGIVQYVITHTGNYQNHLEKEGLFYETEYVLSGGLSDQANLGNALNRILGIRQSCNFLFLNTDSESQSKLDSLAFALSGWTANEAAIQIVKMIIQNLWSFAEGVNDCRRLLQGEQVAFVKTEETWAMDLNQIWKTISGETVKPLNDQSGLSYSEYLRLCLYLEPEQVIVSRMADLIQYRMKQYNPSFRLDECLSKAAINCSGEFAGLFSSSHIFLPIRPFYRFEMDRIFQYED